MIVTVLHTVLDPAFRDRADIVQYIGLPPTEAIYDMLHSCLMELMAKGIIYHLVCVLAIQ
jgi:SpoVK/Ycf46/Vps4 family AAA+-type ATPase